MDISGACISYRTIIDYIKKCGKSRRGTGRSGTGERRLRVDRTAPAAAGGQERAGSGTKERRLRADKREPAAAAGQRELTGGAGKMYK
jgi:hypothetical protein